MNKDTSEPKLDGPETIAYQGRMIEIVEQSMLIGDKKKVFEKARRAPGVRFLIFTPEGNIRMTREFRNELNAGKGGYDVRLPGGKVFDTLEEYNKALASKIDIAISAEEAAKKEAKEEVGIEVIGIELHHVSHNGATVDWDLYYYKVDKYTEIGTQDLELGENIEVIDITPQEMWDKCMQGEIKEDRSVGVIMKILVPLVK